MGRMMGEITSVGYVTEALSRHAGTDKVYTEPSLSGWSEYFLTSQLNGVDGWRRGQPEERIEC